MGSLTRRIWVGIIVVVGLWGTFEPANADPVILKLQLPEGRKAKYKHKHRFEYAGDRADLLGFKEINFLKAGTTGEWKSIETVVKPSTDDPNEVIPENVMGLSTVLEKANSSGLFMDQTLSPGQYQLTFNLLNDRSFTWWITPKGKVEKFEPDFTAFKLGREDLVTDLFLAWAADYSPIFPDHPVDEGDTWTAEATYERPFGSYAMMGRKAGATFESTYTVKKIKKKKKSIEVEIKEERRIKRYGAWLEVQPASFYLEGDAIGNGEWVFDATRGLVLSHKMHVFVGNPKVVPTGRKDALPEMDIETNVFFERKLEKLEKE